MTTGKRSSQTGIAALGADSAAAEVITGDAAGVEAEAEAAAAAAALKFSNRIRPIDIIRVPLYERVWEVGAMGQVKCNFVYDICQIVYVLMDISDLFVSL